MWTVASWNVNSLKVRLPHVLQWLTDMQPDVLCLQETKMQDSDFPEQELNDAGYQVIFNGQKTYNGVAVLSRNPATSLAKEFPTLDDPQRRILAVEVDDICVLNLYVPNGSEVGSEKYTYKLDWLGHLDSFTDELLSRHRQVVLLGDFNIAPEDGDVHDPEEWHEKILCSTPERDALGRLLDKGLCDTFRLFTQEDKSYSWWDYRAAGFRRNRGLRIDLILANEALAQSCSAAGIDIEPRKLERPSDHAPVYAVFE